MHITNDPQISPISKHIAQASTIFNEQIMPVMSESKDCVRTGSWTKDEHERFLIALNIYPEGPWQAVAKFISTRSSKQTQTHARKYREKLARRQRGLKKRFLRASEVDEIELTRQIPIATPLPFDPSRFDVEFINELSGSPLHSDICNNFSWLPSIDEALDFFAEVMNNN